MNRFQQEVVKLLSPALEGVLKAEEISELIEIPKQKEKGDLAFPCFRLAKEMRKAPVLIAKDITAQLQSDLFTIESEGAYINFTISREAFAKEVVGEILRQNDAYGSSDIGEGKRNIVEYSSANISKEMHIGYIRGIMIGLSLYKISRFLGYETVAINHLGDYGINFGKIIVAYKRWGDRDKIEAEGVSALQELYVHYNREEEKDPTLMQEAREWFRKLEANDSEAYELWSWFKEISLKDYAKVYSALGAHFDSYAGESFYSDKMPAVRAELLEKNLIFKDEGAELIDLSDHNLPNIIVTTSAGTSLYITRDIAAALYRKKEYDFYKNIYVVGSEQRLHFSQLKAILDKMGYAWSEDIVHVDHGLIMMGDGKISSREGNIVLLIDVLNNSVERTLALIEEKNPNLEDKLEVARQVGYGAIAFKELSTSRVKDYVFDWDDALSFEGETGPYLQYTNVRTHSLLSRAAFDESLVDYDVLQDDYANDIVRLLSQFPETILASFQRYEPALISRYLILVAKAFNKYYQNVTILSQDPKLTSSRLALVKAVSITLENGMKLINMEAPRKM